jgi:hypothetical protein
MRRQEITAAAAGRAPALEGDLGDIRVSDLRVKVPQAAQTGNIGNRFDIENKDWRHGALKESDGQGLKITAARAAFNHGRMLETLSRRGFPADGSAQTGLRGLNQEKRP